MAAGWGRGQVPGCCTGYGWDGGPSASWAAALILPLPCDSLLPCGHGLSRTLLALHGIPAWRGWRRDAWGWSGGVGSGERGCVQRTALSCEPTVSAGLFGQDAEWPKWRAMATGQQHRTWGGWRALPRHPLPSHSGVSPRVSPSPEPAPSWPQWTDAKRGWGTAVVAGRCLETLVPQTL